MADKTTLKYKFVSGVIWGIVEKFSSLLTGFIITIILSRILTPTDYGLVNMIYIFTVIGTVLLDGGFGQAIIQRKSVSSVDISSVFYINLCLSVIIYITLYFCAPFIANFYRQPILVKISRIVFLTIPINALCIIQHTLLTKELKVKELTYVSILSAVISGIVGIILAYKDYRVWALIYQSISYQLVRSVLLWYYSHWRPVIGFSYSFIKSIFGFSMNLLGVFSLAAIFQNIYTMIIGRLYNVSEVGYYNQAFRMQSMASGAVMSSIQRVAFPAFANFQDDTTALKRVYRKVTMIVMSIYFPIMMGLIIVSYDIFEILFTSKWIHSVPMFCLLCVAESFYPLNNINSAVLKALGKGRDFFILNLINYAIISLAILLTFKYAITILLIGYALSALIRSVISMIVCGREIDYSFKEQVKDIFPIFLVTIGTCIAVYFSSIIPINRIIRLIFSICIGTITFALLNSIIKSALYYEFKEMIHK